MSYCQDNRGEIFKKTYGRYHYRGGKEKAAKYFRKNADLLRYKANMKYKIMSKKEKDRKYQKEGYHNPKYNEHLKEYQQNYDRMKKIKK